MKKTLVIIISSILCGQMAYAAPTKKAPSKAKKQASSATAAATSAPRQRKTLKVDKNSRLYNYTRNPLNKAMIPTYDFINKSLKQGFNIQDVKESVPKLDLQKEPTILAPDNYVLSGGRIPTLKVTDFPKLPQKESPTLKFNFASVEPQKIREYKEELPGFNDGDVVNVKMAEAIAPKISTPPEIKLKPTQLEDKNERDFITLAILYHERKSCPEVMTLGHYLKSKGYNKPEVNFFLGSCQHSRKLYSESVPLLASVIKSGIDHYTHLAVEDLLEDLPSGYDQVIAEALAPKEVYKQLTQKQKDFYNYILAKGRFINGKYADASKLAEIVTPTSKYYYESRYLYGVSEYMRENLDSGIKVLSDLTMQLSSDELKKNELTSLAFISLGRFYFERGRYQDAIKAYESVKREHPLWFDALVEKGWAQIRLKQYPEAIGNMYTLHSKFFTSVFKPETYVIQTIGYLNMCQFGSADETLLVLEKDYLKWGEFTKAYLEDKNKSAYKTLMSYISSKDSQKDIDGLPFQVIREMGRDKEFLALQKKLNNIIDEINYYQSAVKEIMTIRNQIKTDLAALEKEVQSLNSEIDALDKRGKTAKAQAKEAELTTKRQELVLASYRISLIDQGFSTYRNLTGDSTKRVMKIRDAYIDQAEVTLKKSLATIDSRLEKVLKNNDLLRYEIFANSGKNVRYRAAGGQISNRVPAKDIKKTKKDYGWSFKGEFWADEIGKFVANVPDLCPKK